MACAGKKRSNTRSERLYSLGEDSEDESAEATERDVESGERRAERQDDKDELCKYLQRPRFPKTGQT